MTGLRSAVAFGLVMLTGVGCSAPEAVEKRFAVDGSNLVIVLSDTLRAANLPHYGYPRETAPRLGELAADGLVFEHHLANYPGTPISVSQMLTGRLMPPLLMGFTFGLAPVKGIEDDLLILPRELQKAGYETALVSSHPWYDDTARVLPYFATQHLEGPHRGEVYAPMERLVPPALEFLDQRAEDGRPFFLMVHSMDTHGPHRVQVGFEAPPMDRPWPAAYNRYDSEILYTDHHFGRIVDHLDRRGLLDDTVVVFTSDHGEEFHEMGRGWWDEAHGATVRRAQLHVPLILRAPPALGVLGAYDRLSRHVDFVPTILRLVQPELDLSPFRLDGRDVLTDDETEGAARASFSHSWRYWGLHRETLEAHYDQWTDAVEVFQVVPDEHNFPRLESVDGSAAGETLIRDLRTEHRRRVREHLALPPSNLAGALVGLPTWVVRREGTPAPSFRLDNEDGLWSLKANLSLGVGPGERPPPITLTTPWSPGTYAVAGRFAQPGPASRASRLRLRFLGTDSDAVEVEVSHGRQDRWLNLGRQRLGPLLGLEVEALEGGFVLSGLRLRRIGAPDDAATIDPETEEQLRALGYVR